MPQLISHRRELTLNDFFDNPNWKQIGIKTHINHLQTSKYYTLFWVPSIDVSAGFENSYIKCQFYYTYLPTPFTVSSIVSLNSNEPIALAYSVSVNENGTNSRLFYTICNLSATNTIKKYDLHTSDYSHNFLLFELVE